MNSLRPAPLVVLAAAAATLGGCGFNTIPTNEERARAEWANVQNQYQRRADLVPNLVRTVEAAAASERGILTEVIEARARATSVNVTPETLNDPAAFQQYQAAQGELSQALSRLLLVVEQYPQVQSNQNFLTLQSQLEGTENRIAVARRDYNEAVRVYNTSLRTFPTVIWANTVHSGSDRLPEFTATAEAQAAPDVTFNIGGRDPSQPTPPGAAPGSPPPVQPAPVPIPNPPSAATPAA
ncbi:LemA family protein [Brevundimonas lutea]|uniref:LemA family protein n=1 Tax=Brevundimonas lutea TaxID=2293980 RepID=UPI000F03AF03|nr:LemA family protein [Brevundimonas lutea]